MDVYLKIKRAAIDGKSLRLTASDCHRLYFGDEAVRAAADNLDGWRGMPKATGGGYTHQRFQATRRR